MLFGRKKTEVDTRELVRIDNLTDFKIEFDREIEGNRYLHDAEGWYYIETQSIPAEYHSDGTLKRPGYTREWKVRVEPSHFSKPGKYYVRIWRDSDGRSCVAYMEDLTKVSGKNQDFSIKYPNYIMVISRTVMPELIDRWKEAYPRKPAF